MAQEERRRGDDSAIETGQRDAEDTRAETILYDASCRLCTVAARLVDRNARGSRLFRLAPLASDAFERLVPPDRREALPDSLVVSDSDGRLLTRSTAVVHVLVRLGGPWRLWGRLLRWVPRPARDLVYDLVARVRRLLPPVRQPRRRGPSGLAR